MSTSHSASGQPSTGVLQRIQRIVSESIFALQLACWPCIQISPIQQLPPELLSEIFAWCLPEADKPSKVSIRSAPLNVASVCKSWRALALSLPRLWTSFRFTQGLSSDGDSAAVLATRLWLERSRKRPVSFTIRNEYNRMESEYYKRPNYGETEKKTFLKIFDNLSVHMGRWKDVVIDYDFVHPSLQTIELSMPSLRVVEDLHIRLPFNEAPVSLYLAFASRLRSLSLSCQFECTLGYEVFVHLKKVHMDYGRHYKKMGTVYAEDVLMILRHAPNIEVFSAYIYGRPDESKLNEDRTVTLHALRTLLLRYRDKHGGSFKSVVDVLATPALKNLELYIGAHTGADSLGIADLLSRSHASLTSLKIRAPDIRAAELLGCMRGSPDLERLSITHFRYGVLLIIDELTPHPEASAAFICPKLETIELHAGWLRCAYDDFARMIARRWEIRGEGGWKRLREVRLTRNDVREIERIPCVRDCIMRGLQLVEIDR